MSERIYRDPVHNIIRLRTDTAEGELMMKLIDASEFQRLRRIKQLGATGTYVGSAMALGTDGSIYVGGYGNIGLPSSSNGNGFSGGVTDGFITVMK